MARQSLIERNTLVPIELPQTMGGNGAFDNSEVNVTIPLEGGMKQYADDDAVVDYGDDDAFVTFGGERMEEMGDASEHGENLAKFLTESERNRIAADLKEMVDSDEKTRTDWRRRLSNAMRAFGVMSANAKAETPFDGAADVIHPMIAEAAVQFNARAYPELMPPTGPVKGKVIGDETEEKREARTRIEDHMNYQIMEEDETYADEMDNLLMYISLAGSGFKKTYFDHSLGYTTSKFVRGEDVLIPYNATSLEDAPRYSIRIFMHSNELRRKQLEGLYLDTSIQTPFREGGPVSSTELQRDYNRADGVNANSARAEDTRHTLFETYIHYNVPGFEHKDHTGEETGLHLPYVMTFDYESCKLLGIYRNWRKSDRRQRPRQYLVHYKFMQGLGVYGFGLYHVIGGLAEACTGSIRALLDSAAFASLQGGFKSKDTKMMSSEITIRPGEWQDVDLTAEELKNAFYTPPFKEPSMALFKMLEVLQDNGRRFAGTTEAVVGDAKNTGPVGTTVALIEQGTKVQSGIHRRLHRAQQKEFEIRAEINAEVMPQTAYWYETNGGSKYISKDDYNSGAVKVVPVSDPNITSTTQRIAIAQGVMQMAETAPPGLYKLHKVHARMLHAMGVMDTEEILNDPDKVQQFDAVCEGSRIMAGKPVKVYPNQNHMQHNQLHMAQIEFFKGLPDEQQAQALIMATLDHMAKHDAYRMYAEISAMTMQQTGQPLPPIDLYSDEAEDQMPDEVEAQVTAIAAANVQQIMQFYQSRIPPPPEDQETQAKIQREQAAFDEEEKRKQIAFMGDEKRKEDAFIKESARKATEAKLQQVAAAEDAEEEKADRKAEREDRKEERVVRKAEREAKMAEIKVKKRDSEASFMEVDKKVKAVERTEAAKEKREKAQEKALADAGSSITKMTGQITDALTGMMQAQQAMMETLKQMQAERKEDKEDETEAKMLQEIGTGIKSLLKEVAAAKSRKPRAYDVKFKMDENGDISGARLE